MMMEFAFQLDRAVQALAYLLERLGPTDKVKLMKLMYLADRQHFIDVGYPITGDAPQAMPLGPVPSATLAAVNGDLAGSEQSVYPFIHLDDHRVSLRKSPGTDQLSASEKQALDQVIADHGAKTTWKLVGETHRLPEYVECFVEGSSRPIEYDRIARLSGNPRRYHNGRPVISREALSRMNCPLTAGEEL
jgi:uncharacterized phage-associated protein